MGMTITGLQRRCDRLFQKADDHKKFIEENETIHNCMDHKFVRARRQMFALYSEASTLSICLATFRDSCYEPLGPLV